MQSGLHRPAVWLVGYLAALGTASVLGDMPYFCNIRGGIPECADRSTCGIQCGPTGPKQAFEGANSVVLFDGDERETAVDVILPGRGLNWAHQRVYYSDKMMTNVDGANTQGYHWLASSRMALKKVSLTEYTFYPMGEFVSLSQPCKGGIQFVASGNSFVSTDPRFRATMTLANSMMSITAVGTGITYVFQDPPLDGVRFIFKQLDRHGNKIEYEYPGNEHTGQPTGAITSNGAGTGWKVTYEYVAGGENVGKLEFIKVYAASTASSEYRQLQVEYTYFDTVHQPDHHNDVGDVGDLIRVKVTTKMTSGSDEIKETLYRYYRNNSGDGAAHQLKAIIGPASVKALVDDSPWTSDQLLTMADNEPFTVRDESKQISQYFDRTFKYHTSSEDTASLATSYGGQTPDILDESTSGRVKQVTDYHGCGSCGGSSGGTSTFHYMYPASPQTQDPPNDVALIAVVDREYSRRLSYLNHRGMACHEVVAALDGSYQHWIKTFVRSAEYQVTGLHYGENNTRLGNVFDYTGEGFVASMGIDPTDGAAIAQARYDYTGIVDQYDTAVADRPDLVHTVTRFRTVEEAQAEDPDPPPPQTNYSYTFWDAPGSHQKIREVCTSQPAVLTDHNGPGGNVHVVQRQWFDEQGRLRWSKDGEGKITYRSYDPDTSQLALVVVDVNTTSLPDIMTAGSEDTWRLGWSGDVPANFQTSTGLNWVTQRIQYDDLGRPRRVRDAEGMETYYAYLVNETRQYSAFYLDGSTPKVLLPIRVTKTDNEGHMLEQFDYDSTGVTLGVDGQGWPTGSESLPNQTNYTSWMRYEYTGDQLKQVHRYHTIPTSGVGNLVADYYTTIYQYDSRGRRTHTIQVVDGPATGANYSNCVEQVTANVYDAQNRVVEIREAVSPADHSMGSDYTNYPTPVTYNNEPSMFRTTRYRYGDGGGAFDPNAGNLRYVDRFYGADESLKYTTEYRYDGRNRRILTLPPLAPFTVNKYDHQDRLVATGQYKNDLYLSTSTDPTTMSMHRIGLSETAYDEMGRVCRSIRHNIDASDGSSDGSLATNNFYDRDSRLVASVSPGGGARETQYDGAGRAVQQRMVTALKATKYDGQGAFQYVDSNGGGNGGIVQATDYLYTEADNGAVKLNVRRIISRELNHNDTNGMDLTSGGDFIRTYTYSYYDLAHRTKAVAVYGTNNTTTDSWADNATAPDYGTSIPSSIDTRLVSLTDYDAAGRVLQTTDPMGRVTRFEYNRLGQRTAQIEDHGGIGRRTEYVFNGLGSMTFIKAIAAAECDPTNSGLDEQWTQYIYGSTQNSSWVTEVRYPTGHGRIDQGGAILGVGTDPADKVTFTYRVDGTQNTRTDQNGTAVATDYDDAGLKWHERVTAFGTGVDNTVKRISYAYSNLGQLASVTTYNHATVGQGSELSAVAYAYNGFGQLIADSQDVDGNGAFAAGTVQYQYSEAVGDANHSRLKSITYPNGRQVWYGYKHTDGAGSFQQAIDEAFSRPGLIAMGYDAQNDQYTGIMAQYTFNGLGRMVTRSHATGTGWAGNATRLDYYNPTGTPSSGRYPGLDRFGRIIDQRHIDVGGASAIDMSRTQYAYDRNGNRTQAKDVIYATLSHKYAYDNLNRLTDADQGIISTYNGVDVRVLSAMEERWTLDKLGNWSSWYVDDDSNPTVTHGVNATNEVSSLAVANQAGAPLVVSDDFSTDYFSSFSPRLWLVDGGGMAVSGGKAWTSSQYATTAVVGDSRFANACYQVTLSGPNTTSAGILFANTSFGNYWKAEVQIGSPTSYVYIREVIGTTTYTRASTSIALSSATCTMTVNVSSKTVTLGVTSGSNTASTSYTNSTAIPTGRYGLCASGANIWFDDFKAYDLSSAAPLARRTWGSSKVNWPGSGEGLEVRADDHDGQAVIEGFWDDDYNIQASLKRNNYSGAGMQIRFRYRDPNNYYAAEMTSLGSLKLLKTINGASTQVASGGVWTPNGVWQSVRLKVSGNAVKVWVNVSGNWYLIVDATVTGDILSAGGVALWAYNGRFKDLKIGYDGNADNDLDDAGTDVVAINEPYDGTSLTPAYDPNGNLTDDGVFHYIYDAWNRLVKVEHAGQDGYGRPEVAVYAYDGTGRRVSKTLSHRGDLDGTEHYYYDGQKQIEMRQVVAGESGPTEQVMRQYVWGTQYIDELIREDVNGDPATDNDCLEAGTDAAYYFHQDANYNVTAVTDAAGDVVQRISYSAYGRPTFTDGSGRVGSGPTFGPAGNKLHTSAVAWQGLFNDRETGHSYNRARTLDHRLGRFMQRDPLNYIDGTDAYVYVHSSPLGLRDPAGKLAMRQVTSSDSLAQLTGSGSLATAHINHKAMQSGDPPTTQPVGPPASQPIDYAKICIIEEAENVGDPIEGGRYFGKTYIIMQFAMIDTTCECESGSRYVNLYGKQEYAKITILQKLTYKVRETEMCLQAFKEGKFKLPDPMSQEAHDVKELGETTWWDWGGCVPVQGGPSEPPPGLV